MNPIWRPLWGAAEVTSDPFVHTADVVVIGAGIAGVTTALELRRSGMEVLLLEARLPGAGTTGRTTAKVTAGHALIYTRLAMNHGMDVAKHYAQAQLEALAYFTRHARFHSMIQEVDHHVFSDDDIDPLLQEQEITRSIGLTNHLNSDPALPLARAALTYPGQFQIDPKQWLTYLLEEYRSLGGRLITGVRARDVEDGEPVRIVTDQGEITAHEVIVATHFPISHQILGAPRLSTNTALVVSGPSTLEISDTWIAHDDSLSIRSARDPQGQVLVISGEPHRSGTFDVPAAYHRLSELAQARFGVTELRYYWSAHDLYAGDHLPYIGLHLPTSEHVRVASGFGSWGMTNGTFAGLMLAQVLTGVHHPLEEIFDPRRIGFVPPAPQAIRESGEAIRHLIGERLTHAFTTSSPDELSPGQGCVVRDGTQFVAMSKDSDGNLYRVSAACTHLGCLVSWNQGDQTWDCPCHGSRFTAAGEVIEGPATSDLSPHVD